VISYLGRRLFTMVWTLVGISILVFIIIQLPPGDYLTTYIAEIQAQGETVGDDKVQFLREQYGLDKPLWQQYLSGPPASCAAISAIRSSTTSRSRK
jgi:peptide/nickel transport system permease protein